MRTLLLFTTAVLLSCVAFAQGGTQTKKPAQASQKTAEASKEIQIFDRTALDKAADPCVDFYQYSCGGWMKRNPIPPDQAIWGRFNQLAERNRELLHQILEAAANNPQATGNEKKIGDYYSSCMDEAAINKKGVAVLKPEFDHINELKDKQDLPSLIAYLHSHGFGGLFSFSSGPDFKNADMVIAQADQGGLSLPDRDYYLKTDAKSVQLRTQYLQHVTNMFKLMGDAPAKAAAEAQTVLKVETALAKGAMDRVERRDPPKIYHKLSAQEWQQLTPAFSYEVYLTNLGLHDLENLNVAVPDFFKSLNEDLQNTSIDDFKTYLRWHVIHGQAEFLPTPFVNENFNFFGKTLLGSKQLEARWKRCTSAVDNDMGEALGQVFVQKHFPPEAKERTLRMVKQVEDALRKDITELPWMTEATKKQALVKLEAIQNKIGYPDKWRDYSTLTITRGDAIGNSLRANQFEFHRELNKIGKPLDRGEWQMTPPTVNAYYDSSENDINFPAGILQPPFYDFKADDALNFGGIGAVIGHELTHGFDDQGRLFDARGNLHDWWTPEDGKAFEQRAQCLVDEYDSFVAVDDVHLKGKLTLGENTADNGGLRIALMALEASSAHGDQPAPKIDGYTPEQRLFLGWGQVWCQNESPQIARLLAQTNEHSPGKYRVNGVVSNMPEFQKAWGCKPGQPMVRQNACRVW